MKAMNKYNLVYRHTEMGRMVARLSESFSNQREAKLRLRELRELGECLELLTQEELENDRQYRRW